MAEHPKRWNPDERDQFYCELDHPADVFLEVWGANLSALFENALFALYDQLAEMEGFQTVRVERIEAQGATPADALRALLSEALYRFAAVRFVAAKAKVTVDQSESAVKASAELHGEEVDPTRHTLCAEVKGVTYHQLSVKQSDDGWTATVLFDV